MAILSYPVRLHLTIEFDTLSDKEPRYPTKPDKDRVLDRIAGRSELPMTLEDLLSDILIKGLEREGIGVHIDSFEMG